MQLIKKGKAPEEILKQLSMPPSKFQRMMSSKRLQAWLKMEEQLASAIVGHKIAADVVKVAERLTQLMEDKSPETARKVCLALLNEATQAEVKKETSKDTSEKTPPWMLIEPAYGTPKSHGENIS